MLKRVFHPAFILASCLFLLLTAGMPAEAQEVAQKTEFPTLELVSEPIPLGEKGLERAEYMVLVDKYLQSKYPDIGTENEGYRFFVRKLAFYVKIKGGNITERVNGLIENYNRFAEVARYIQEAHLHPEFKRDLINHYYEIVQGTIEADDVEPIKAAILQIPPDSHFIKVQAGDRLDELVLKFHPGFMDLTDEQKKEVFDYLVEINPFVEEPGMIHDVPGPGRDISLKIFGNRDKACSLHVPSKGYTLYYFLRENHTIAIPRQLPHLPAEAVGGE